jgi:hypothetical protein
VICEKNKLLLANISPVVTKFSLDILNTEDHCKTYASDRRLSAN